MTMLETLRLWNQALLAWDAERDAEALEHLRLIPDPSSRILFNIGGVHLSLGDLRRALQCYDDCIGKDEHLSVAFYQRGVTQYKLKRYNEAEQDLKKCHNLLRGKPCIDFTQLDMNYKLYACEVLHNQALCLVRLQRKAQALELLRTAYQEKVQQKHCSIKQTIEAVQDGRIPDIMEASREAMFRPSKSKVANMSKKNYLGKAQVISAVDEEDNFSGFSGPRRVSDGEVLISKSAGTSPNNKKRSQSSTPGLTGVSGHGPPPDRPPPQLPTVGKRVPNDAHGGLDVFELSKVFDRMKTSGNTGHRPLTKQKSSSAPTTPPPGLPPKPSGWSGGGGGGRQGSVPPAITISTPTDKPASSMSTLETLQLWNNALLAWDGGNETEALRSLDQITDPSSRILFNIGSIHLCKKHMDLALQYYDQCISKDNHLSLAFFQRGVAHYSLKSYAKAEEDFAKSHEELRGRPFIDYTQLGIKFKLYSCEAMHNQALCLVQLNRQSEAVALLHAAEKCRAERRHDVIKEAIENIQRGKIGSILEIRRDAMFRPDKSKVANMGKKDYLGQAKVIAAVDEDDKFAGFSGPRRVSEGNIIESKSAPSSPGAKKRSQSTTPVMFSHGRPPDRPPPSPPLFPKRSIPSNNDPVSLDVSELSRAFSKLQSTSTAPNHPRLVRQGSSSAPDTPPGRSPRSSGYNMTPPKLPAKPSSADTGVIRPAPAVPAAPKKGTFPVVFHCRDVYIAHVNKGCKLDQLHEKACIGFGVAKEDFDIWYRRPGAEIMVRITTDEQLQDVWTKAQSELKLWYCNKA